MLPASLIQFVGVEKTYRLGKLDYRALRGIDLSVGGRDRPESPNDRRT